VHGAQTCNKRNTRTYIATCYPHFNIEEGFAESDELWSPTICESNAQVAERARKVLDVVFENDIDALCKMKLLCRSIYFVFIVFFGSCFYYSSWRIHKWISNGYRKAKPVCTDGR
jgi:hypothetical protein